MKAKSILQVITLCWLTVYATANELVRVKTQDNQSLQIRIICYDPQTNLVTYASNTGAIRCSPLEHFHTSERASISLHIADQKHIENWSGRILEAPKSFPPAAPKGWSLVGWNKGDRSHIQSLNRHKFGKRKQHSSVTSVINTLKWWDDLRVVNLPQKRSESKQINWLYNSLASSIRASYSVDPWKDLSKGLNHFSKTKLSGDYLFPCFRIYDLSPEKLAFYTQGCTAANLSLSVYHGKRYQYSHAVSVISIKPNGEIRFNIFGMKMSGKLQPIGDQKIPEQIRHYGSNVPRKAPAYTIILNNRTELPEYLLKEDIQLLIEPKRGDSLYCYLPYKKLNDGDQWVEPPVSSVFTPSKKQKKEPKQKVSSAKAVTFFDTEPPNLDRKWKSADGKVLNASLTAFGKGGQLTFLKGTQDLIIPLKRLSQQDQIRAEFWKSAKGSKYELPASTLHFVARSKNGNKKYKFTIHYDGQKQAMTEFPHLSRAIFWNSQSQKLEIYNTKNDTKVQTLKVDLKPAYLKNNYPFSSHYKWKPIVQNGYTSHSHPLRKFTDTKVNLANVQANAVTELLGCLYGWTQDRFLSPFQLRTIPCWGNEPSRSLGLARKRELLPVYIDWENRLKKETGSLELISIELGTSANFW